MTEFDAVKTRLETTGYDVYDGEAVNEDGNPFQGSYFVLYGGNLARVDDGRLSKGQDPESDRDVEFTVRSVSLTAGGARNLDRVGFGALVGWTPELVGRHARAVGHEASDPPVLDSTVRPACWFADSDYSFASCR